MTWSYSRLSSFNDCKYKWFLTYLENTNKEDKFYASYGTYMHKIIDMYYNDMLDAEDMRYMFIKNFSTEVRGERPDYKIVQSYMEKGLNYLGSFVPFEFQKIATEKRMEFTVGENEFVGYIDYIGKLEDGFCIVDNKSRDLKPRSRRKTPTKKDLELDSMLKQLYLYSAAIKQEYGEFPKELCFNCFKSGVFIKEPFNIDEYNKTIEWANNTIMQIKGEEDFQADPQYFKCKYICDVSNECCYYLNR